VTFTAGVSVTSPGSGHPSGTVEFKDGGTDIGGCAAQPVNTFTEAATCTTSALTVATHNITAVYSGDSNFVGSSTASAVSQTVNKAASVVTTAPVTPVTQGQPASFTALVAAKAPGAGTPTGTVTFYEGTKSLGAGQLVVTDGKAQAIFTTRGLTVGAHTITAGYGGDGDFTTSTSAAFTQYVNTNLSGYPKLANGAYNLSNAYLVGGYFVNAPLAGIRLTNSNLTNAIFTAADLTGADLSNSNFKGASFSGANLSGATLTNSTLKGATGLTTATLSNVIWSNTTCPDSTVSNNDGGTCAGHL
jgi:Big-like domain-containing protein/pentapeptide repeat protein